MIVTQSNTEQLTTARLQAVNTPFGKQLHSIAKALMSEHSQTQKNEKWADDYCLILKGTCSNSWSQRMIAEEMA